MKADLYSDIHLEFMGPEFMPNSGDILFLAGDIMTARNLNRDETSPKRQRYREFLIRCSRNYDHVFYVAGNHEHYHGDFATTLDEIKRKLKYLPNLIVLDKETWDLFGETRFIGGTLWTDMNKEDPLTLHAMKKMMNDFRCVKNSNREVHFKDEGGKFHTRVATFSPEDAVEEHRKSLDYIKTVYADTPPWMNVVVVGHHTPSHTSCHPRYKDDQIMNGGYHSDLSEFILDRPGIKLWTHGHTHENFDYMIGSTRIVCNPRGYDGYEDIADKFELKVIEL